MAFRRVLQYLRIGAALRSRGLDAADLATQFQLFNEVIAPAPLLAPVCRDPDDDAVLACAVSAKATLIVSGDRDLLALAQYQGIAILSASQAVNLLNSQTYPSQPPQA